VRWQLMQLREEGVKGRKKAERDVMIGCKYEYRKILKTRFQVCFHEASAIHKTVKNLSFLEKQTIREMVKERGRR
jgi:hypothetical protein